MPARIKHLQSLSEYSESYRIPLHKLKALSAQGVNIDNRAAVDAALEVQEGDPDSDDAIDAFMVTNQVGLRLLWDKLKVGVVIGEQHRDWIKDLLLRTLNYAVWTGWEEWKSKASGNQTHVARQHRS